MKKYKAKEGLGYILNKNWQPALKTLSAWKKYAAKEANKISKPDGILWQSNVIVTDNDTIRINYCFQKHP